MASVTSTRARFGTIDWSSVSKAEFWLEAAWLGALGLVPVLFSYRSSFITFDESKSYALHFFALATLVVLAWDVASRFVAARQRGENVGSIDVTAWLRADKANLLLGLIAVFTFVYAISTALSPMPFFSLWGAAPASGGYSFYSFASMTVILLAVVTRMRTVAQVWRVLYVIAAVGTLTSIYGVSQHFGWDPLRELSDANRVFSSFGNPIYFGAYLVMSIPITVAIGLDPLFKTANALWAFFKGQSTPAALVRSVALLALVVSALSLQLLAMWFTGSRGPLVGLGGASIAVVVGMAFLLPKRHLVIAASFVVAGSLVLGITGVITGDVSEARSLQFGGQLTDLVSADGGGRIEGGLGGRGEIWGDVLELAVSWDTLPEDEGLEKVLRPLFGFGPDMLRFSTSLVAQPRTSLEIVDHAHNRPLHVLAEQGWVGFVILIAIIGVVGWLLFLTGLNLIRGGRSNSALNIAFIAVFGAMTGVAFEQLTGVGRVSDLLTSWVLVGIVVVLFRMTAIPSPEAVPAAKSRGSAKRVARRAEGSLVSALPFTVGLAAAVIALVVFVLVDVQMISASRTASDRGGIVDKTEIYNKYIDARDSAPQIEFYTVTAAELLIDDARTLLELDRRDDAVVSANRAWEHLIEYHERNPLALKTRILLAETAALLLEMGAIDFRLEMIARYENLAEQFPNEGNVIAILANAYAAAASVGGLDPADETWLYEQSLLTTDRAIAVEAQTNPLPQAWWVRGVALTGLGREDEAIAAFETAIDRNETSDFAKLSHENLAKIYDRRGETELADIHRSAAQSN